MPKTVSVLARSVGVSTDTIRYYERLGLLPAPERSAGGYRIYDDRADERVRLIRRAQSVGLQLTQIGVLLQDLDRGTCPCPTVDQLLRQRILAIESEMARLEVLRAAIVEVQREFADPCTELEAPGVSVLLNRLDPKSPLDIGAGPKA